MRSILVVSLMLLACSTFAATCLSSATSDDVPANPGIPNLPAGSLMGKTFTGCSEFITIPTMGAYYPQTWQRTDCPHLQSGLTPLETLYPSLAAGQDVVINSPTKALLRQCALPSGPLRRITVKAGAQLIFDDSNIDLHVREIAVEEGGALLAGSETCRLFSSINITYYGTKADSNVNDNPTAATTSKGLLVSGLVEFHGKQYHPTWTRLARTAYPRANLLYLQDAVNWEVGQDVLITTTILLDCPDYWAATWCQDTSKWPYRTVTHQNEIRRIAGISIDTTTHNYVLALDRNLTYSHYGGVEYQAEVALLSRRITFYGQQTGDKFGCHTKVQGNGEGRFSGVRAENCGQLNVLGRYPFHFHMMFETPQATRSYFQECVVTNSNFRCFVVHGTNNTRVSRNVGFNVTGMCYYLEDGVEERNLLEYNLAAHVHPIYRPADGGYGQGGETFMQSADLIVPADTSASGFYIPNAYNTFIGNAASGGWSGFAFPNTPAPLGNFQNTLSSTSNWNPEARPLLKFDGNTGHSTGFYWKGHGSIFYVGARLDYDSSSGLMRYMSGRNDRTTKFLNGSSSIMIFSNLKGFLARKGLAHWGNTVEVQGAEFHDTQVSAMLFGNAAMNRVLVNARTPNLASQYIIGQGKMGFQFYDTWVRTILSNVTFRNFSSAYTDYAVRYMDHSDHYTPQGINSVANLRFESSDSTAILGIDHCGSACGSRQTMSSKIYSVWDWDGSFSRTGRPTILGSNIGWWNHSDANCRFIPDMKIFICDWKQRTTVGYIEVGLKSLTGDCDYAKFGTCGSMPCCDDQTAPNYIGRYSHWGAPLSANKSIDVGPWSGTSGLANTGWYFRAVAKEYGIDGAPSFLEVGENFQLPRNNFIVLAIAYPPQAQFRVYIRNKWWSTTFPDIPMSNYSWVTQPREQLNPVSQFRCTGVWWGMCTNTGGVGPAWHFDGNYLYLRLVAPACYNSNQKQACIDAWYNGYGVAVPGIMGGFIYTVNVTSCPGCTVQSTYAGVRYYSVADVPPPQTFVTDWGNSIPTPSGVPASKPKNSFSCGAPAPIVFPDIPTDGSGGGSGGGGSGGGSGAPKNGTLSPASLAAPAWFVLCMCLLFLLNF